MIIRWSIWDPAEDSLELLAHSIGTFRRFFGTDPTYVVTTNAPTVIDGMLPFPVEAMPFDSISNSAFDDPRATWRKWAPQPRLDIRQHELRVDADMFLLRDPVELLEFCDEASRDQFIVTQEEFHAVWPYGNFGALLPDRFIPVNAGLLGQAPGADLSERLSAAYGLWSSCMANDYKYHDEQGAVSWVLQDLIAEGKVRLLPPYTYRVVCPLNYPPVESLEGITLLHATYPDHPAFHKFKDEIAKVSGMA